MKYVGLFDPCQVFYQKFQLQSIVLDQIFSLLHGSPSTPWHMTPVVDATSLKVALRKRKDVKKGVVRSVVVDDLPIEWMEIPPKPASE